jgi:hypothetical protein
MGILNVSENSLLKYKSSMQFLDLSSNKDFKNNAKQNLEFLLYGHTKRFIQGHAPTSFKNGHPKWFMQIIYIY